MMNMNERKKLRTELKVQLLVKNERLLNEPLHYVNLTDGLRVVIWYKTKESKTLSDLSDLGD